MGGGIKVNILNKEAKKFWTEKGLFWGAPSGLKKGPVGPHGPRMRVLIVLIMKDPDDRTFEAYIF